MTPWIKFLWETYRNILDCLCHTKLFHVYRETIEEAFAFCLKYRRLNEFKRLNDLIKQHFQKLSSDDESILQLQLEIRLSQLNTAVALECWQEAFKSLESINNIIQSQEIPTPSVDVVLTYYEKLAKLFWVSENYIFHANALLKYYYHLKKAGKEDQDPFLETKILLACLSVPISPSAALPKPRKCQQYFSSSFLNQSYTKQTDEVVEYLEANTEREKHMRMATSLGFYDFDPMRESLLQGIVTGDILPNVVRELKDLYDTLEDSFQPLTLGSVLAEKLKFIDSEPEIRQYYKSISSIGFVKILQQLSKVYNHLKTDSFRNLVPFINDNEIERLTLHAIRSRLVECRINHQLGILLFDARNALSNETRSVLPDIVRNMHIVSTFVEPESVKEERKVKRQEQLSEIMNKMAIEHELVLERKIRIERAKVERETMLEEERTKIEIEERERQRKMEEQAEAKKKAMQDALEAKQKAQRQKELEQQERNFITEKIKEIATRYGTKTSKSLYKKFDEGSIDSKTYIELQVKQILSDKDKSERKLSDTTEKFDHIVRARREKEIEYLPKLKKSRSEQLEGQVSKITEMFSVQHKTAWTINHEQKERLSRFKNDKNSFENTILTERKNIYDEQVAEREEKLKVLKAQKAKEQEERKKQEEERRKQEEEKRKQLEQEQKQKEAPQRQEPSNVYVPPRRQESYSVPKKETSSNVYVPPRRESNVEGSWRSRGDQDSQSKPRDEKKFGRGSLFGSPKPYSSYSRGGRGSRGSSSDEKWR